MSRHNTDPSPSITTAYICKTEWEQQHKSVCLEDRRMLSCIRLCIFRERAFVTDMTSQQRCDVERLVHK